MLTEGSVWAEGGRRGEIDERSGAPARLAMAAGDGGLDSAARRLNRARGGAEQVRGEAAQLGARGIEAERRTATSSARARARLDEDARKEKGRGEMDEPCEWIRTRSAEGEDRRRVRCVE